MSGAAAYYGERAALLTQHGKERWIVPRVAAALSLEVELAVGFDTDTLGTFTRDVPRAGTQAQAARRKAQKGMELTGLPLGIASEGAFSPGLFGLYPTNLELVILVDAVRGIELVGSAAGHADVHHALVGTCEVLLDFAHRAGFPEHGLVVRPDDEHDVRVRKGAADEATLVADFYAACFESRSGLVFVESDLRAHRNPTRQEVIGRAVDDLVTRAAMTCPRCKAQGFGHVARVPGLPCAACRTPTGEALAERWACARGDYDELRELGSGGLANPFQCNRCNP